MKKIIENNTLILQFEEFELIVMEKDNKNKADDFLNIKINYDYLENDMLEYQLFLLKHNNPYNLTINEEKIKELKTKLNLSNTKFEITEEIDMMYIKKK